MRARPPDREGHVEPHRTRIHWEEHGRSERAVLFIPRWQIADRMLADSRPETTTTP
jgi:hypothetical protein